MYKLLSKPPKQGSSTRFIQHFTPSARLVPPNKPKIIPLCEKHCDMPLPSYGGRYLTAMISGDGIGKELMHHVEEIFHHATVPLDCEHIYVKSQEDFENATKAIKRCGTALKSNIDQFAAGIDEFTDSTLNITIKKNLDVYLKIIHWKSYPGLERIKFKNLDLVMITQNTEGEYAMLEHENVRGVVECLKVITKHNSERIGRSAFEFARTHGRKKVTVVHKANIMKLADGLFLKTVRDISKEYPEIKLNDVIVDNCCMQIVTNPHQYDVLVMPNLYGNIISNIINGLLGGPGLYAACNYGEYYAIFEPVSRSLGKNITGKNVANPVTMLNAGIGLLHYLNLSKYAAVIEQAVFNVITKDRVHTVDIGGNNTSTEMLEKIKDNISILMK